MSQKNIIKFNSKNITNKLLKELYRKLIYPRLIEEKMLLLLRQSRISKWFSGIGQEAIPVGLTSALQKDEYILPMHRNLGVFTGRNIPLSKLFAQWQGKESGFTKGRDRSFHFGSKSDHIVGMISHLGPQMGVACGIALAEKLSNSGKITAVFTGDGGTSEGDFHEALNIASVWNLPVLFVIEHNGYGLSTPNGEQFNFDSFTAKGPAYGIEAHSIDGNNVLEVFSEVKKIAKKMRKDSKPVILECRTFRMRGHEESSGTKYVPKELFEHWEKLCPVENYESFLISENIFSDKELENIKSEMKKYIENEVEPVFNLPNTQANSQREINDVFAPFVQKITKPKTKTKKMRFVDAVKDGLDEAMKRHNNLILMGQDIAEYGGVFKITDGFLEEYGKERVRNTPICESAILSAALGLSIKNYKAMVEMQFADFVSSGFTAIVNNIAKIHYRWGHSANLVVRMPTGAGLGAGPFHSQSNEAWFFNTPGLKIVYPSNPEDAKGLLLASFEDENPVMFFEHKGLYRSISGDVPEGYYTFEIGKAKLVEAGSDLTIITYGAGVHWAKETLIKHPEISADLIDLRTLAPLDFESISKSAKKTGKVIILHEDTLLGGIGSDISAMISRELFENLDAPIFLVGSLETPVPFAKNLEDDFLPKKRFEEELLGLFRY
jgi:2-oxoisovalerate dehydrogenase E1 component